MQHPRINNNLFAKPVKVQLPSGHLSTDMMQLFANKVELTQVMNLLETGNCVHWVSNGLWDMQDMLLAIINRIGKAKVVISSYAMSETAARILTQLKVKGLITHLAFIIDSRVDVRSATSLQTLTAIADKLVLTETHAKVTVVTGEIETITVVGSANYTENKRYEAGLITTDIGISNFHSSWINEALYGMD